MRSRVGAFGGAARTARRSTRSIRSEPLIAATSAVSIRVAVTPSSTSPSARS
jgi:hypothetical protein